MNLFAGLMLLLIVYKTNGSFTPMVAFLCGKPSMYLSDKGWQGVEDVDCPHDPIDTLNFCRRAYPGKKVTNVVQSSTKVTISNWCSVDKRNCSNAEHTVAPFKCVVGEFQSEALLVPEHCEFEHELDEQQCQEVSVWQDTAAKACLDRGLTLDSSAPLSVCGVARFRGVEFVCCPAKTIVKEKNALSSSSGNGKNKGNDIEKDDVELDSDILRKYLRTSSDKDESEHDRYSRAKADLTRAHEDRMAKVMKELAASRLHVQQVKQLDPKRAEKLEQQATKRFEETYRALAEELKMEKLQLSRVHEQRVQSDLNEKKRVAMDNYMDALNDDASKAGEIAKALETYLRVEQKDRLHTVNHYEHLLDTDKERAGDERSHTIDHLKVVSKRIEQAINMLSRVPRLEKKIRVQIAEFMKDSFHDIDIRVAAILAEPVSRLFKDKVLPEVEGNKKAAAKLDDGLPVIEQQTHQSVVKKDGVEEKPETVFSSSIGNGNNIDDSSYEDDYEEDSYEVDEGELVTDTTTATSAPKVKETLMMEAKETEKIDFNLEQYDDETMEDEHNLPDDADLKIAHHEVDGLVAESKSISRGASMVETGASKAAIVGIFVVMVTLFVVVAVGIAVLRQKLRDGRCEVDADDDMSPEDRHVSVMQANGYENPTYKYFENRA